MATLSLTRRFEASGSTTGGKSTGCTPLHSRPVPPGGIGSFQVMDILNYDDYLTFNVDLAATSTAMTSFNAYFVCPVTLNLDAFE